MDYIIDKQVRDELIQFLNRPIYQQVNTTPNDLMIMINKLQTLKPAKNE